MKAAQTVEEVQIAFPRIEEEDVELTYRPLHYLDWRFKALIEQEKLAAMYLKSQQMPQNVKKVILDKDLDIPAGAIKENQKFSHKTFLVGSGNKKFRQNRLVTSQTEQARQQ